MLYFFGYQKTKESAWCRRQGLMKELTALAGSKDEAALAKRKEISKEMATLNKAISSSSEHVKAMKEFCTLPGKSNYRSCKNGVMTSHYGTPGSRIASAMATSSSMVHNETNLYFLGHSLLCFCLCTCFATGCFRHQVHCPQHGCS